MQEDYATFANEHEDLNHNYETVKLGCIEEADLHKEQKRFHK